MKEVSGAYPTGLIYCYISITFLELACRHPLNNRDFFFYFIQSLTLRP